VKKQTLLIGLYHRSKKSGGPEKENSLDFEQFLAKGEKPIQNFQMG
jgi:hypothetical protein